MFSYFRVPKILFRDIKFKDLSTDAKTLYGILLDRMELSAKNGWLDEQGRVYIIFPVQEVMDALGCADNKAMNTINFHKSMHYNLFAYIHEEKDILKLVTTLMANTKGEGTGGDPFWEKSEKLLYTALIAYTGMSYVIPWSSIPQELQQPLSRYVAQADGKLCGYCKENLCNTENERMIVELYLGKQEHHVSRILY